MDSAFLISLAILWAPVPIAVYRIGKKADAASVLRALVIGESVALCVFLLIAQWCRANLVEACQMAVVASLALAWLGLPVLFGSFAIGRERFSLRVLFVFVTLEAIAIAIFIMATQITDL